MLVYGGEFFQGDLWGLGCFWILEDFFQGRFFWAVLAWSEEVTYSPLFEVKVDRQASGDPVRAEMRRDDEKEKGKKKEEIDGKSKK